MQLIAPWLPTLFRGISGQAAWRTECHIIRSHLSSIDVKSSMWWGFRPCDGCSSIRYTSKSWGRLAAGAYISKLPDNKMYIYNMVRFHPWVEMHRINGVSSMIYNMQGGGSLLVDSMLGGDKLSQKMDTVSSLDVNPWFHPCYGYSQMNYVFKKVVCCLTGCIRDFIYSGCHFSSTLWNRFPSNSVSTKLVWAYLLPCRILELRKLGSSVKPFRVRLWFSPVVLLF